MSLQVATVCWCEASASYSECFSARLLERLHDMVLAYQRANVLRARSQGETTCFLGPSLRSHIASLLFLQGGELSCAFSREEHQMICRHVIKPSVVIDKCKLF